MPDTHGNVNARCYWALKLAGDGFKIFPLLPGAKEPPAGESWKEIATSDEATIRAWLENSDLNYGVTGGLVIDVDVKRGKQGDKRLAELEGREPPEEWITSQTFAVRSPSGGAHYYLKAPFPASNAHLLGAGIDVRGENGYVVGPGCELVAGRCKASDTPGGYEVESLAPIMMAPAWIVSRLQSKAERDRRATESVVDLDLPDNVNRARTWLLTRTPAIEGQEGDHHTLVTADHLGDLGVSDVTALELMLEGWNDRCVPPWETDDLAVKVENSYSYRERPLGCKAVNSDAMDAAMAPAMSRLDKELGPAQSSVVETDDMPDDGAGKRKAEQERRRKRFHFKTEAEQVAQEEPPWLLHGVLPRAASVLVIGKDQSFKTFVVLDWALSIVSGQAWGAVGEFPGHKPVPRKDGAPAVALYLAGESARGVETLRVPAWRRARGVLVPEGVNRFYTCPAIPLASDEKDIEIFMREVAAQLPHPPDLMAVDTASRALRGMDENSAGEVGRLVDMSDKFAAEWDCTVVIIHHLNVEGKRGRGSTVLEYDLSTRFLVERDGTSLDVKITNLKQRDSAEWAYPISMRGRSVALPGGKDSLVFDRFLRSKAGDAEACQEASDASQLVRDVGNALSQLAPGATVTDDVLLSCVEHDYIQPGGPWHGMGAHQRDVAGAGLRKRLREGAHERRGRNGKRVPALLARFCAIPYAAKVPMLWKLPASAARAGDVPEVEFPRDPD